MNFSDDLDEAFTQLNLDDLSDSSTSAVLISPINSGSETDLFHTPEVERSAEIKSIDCSHQNSSSVSCEFVDSKLEPQVRDSSDRDSPKIPSSITKLSDFELRRKIASLSDKQPAIITSKIIRKICEKQLFCLEQQTQTSIKILYANLGSWQTRASYFTDLAKKHSASIGIISEISTKNVSGNYWFNQIISSTSYKGVGFTCNSNFIHPQDFEIFDSLAVDLEFDILAVSVFPRSKFHGKDNNFIIIAAYVSPSTSDEKRQNFISLLNDIFQKAKNITSKIILLGDWNITVKSAAPDLGFNSSSFPLATNAANFFIQDNDLVSLHSGFTWQKGEIKTAPDFLLATKTFNLKCNKLESLEARKEHSSFLIELL